jgi:nitroreductase
MEKQAETAYPIHDLLRRRWSPLAFSNQPVDSEKLCSLLEAARWAPSCFNEQPWSYIVATKDSPAEYDRLLSCLVEANQEWARLAPVLMLSVAKLYFERNGKDNRHALHDVGLASENLVIQAMAQGIFVHQMAGFDLDKARQLYSIPERYEPVAAFALGYPGDPDALSDNLQERERGTRIRKPLDAFVFSGSWGQPSSLILKGDQP